MTRRILEDLKESLVLAQESRDLLNAVHPADGMPCWVEFERLVMLASVNAIRVSEDKDPDVTYEEIVAVEGLANGHSDYTVKYALGCEDLVLR